MMRTLLLFGMILAGCTADPPVPTQAQRVIEAHVAGFNARDIDAMRAAQHPEAEWLQVSGSDVSTVSSSREDWNAAMTDLFDDPSDMRGSLRDWAVSGNRVAVVETASVLGEDGRRTSRDTLTAYEIEDGLIRRVWYFTE
ncbi:MAG: nuclear transport factor 2 family protein [Litorimonas sp.]